MFALTELRERQNRYGVGRIRAGIEAFLKPSAIAQASLAEELALLRTLVNDVVMVYEVASTAIGNAQTATDMLKAQNMLEPLQDQIGGLVGRVQSVAKAMVEIDSHHAVKPELLAELAKQLDIAVSSIADDSTREHLEHVIATQLARAIKKSTANDTPVLSPHDTIKAIDLSVPYMPEAADVTTATPSTGKAEELDPKQLPKWQNLDQLEQGKQ